MRVRLLPLAALLAFGFAPTAVAAEPPPQDVSAMWQYQESLPTSSGPIVTGASGTSSPGGGTTASGGTASGGTALGGAGQAATLTPNAAKRLHRQGGADAGLLEALATAPAYGAPQSKSPLAGGAGSSGSGAGGSGKGSGATGPAFDIPTPEAAARSGSAPSAMSAAARALVDTGDSGFRTVPIGLAIATVLLVALGLTKRARARQGAGIR